MSDSPENEIRSKRPATEDRRTVDWDRIEPLYRAGVRSLKDIGSEFGVSAPGILKKAKKEGWSRDLSGKIRAKAEAQVNAAAVNASVNAETKVRERDVIEANAQAIANALLSHRKDIARNRGLANKLLTELEAQVDSPEEFEKLGELMYSPDDKGMDKLNDLYKKVMSLPSRIDGAKKLGETLKVLIALEREAYGVDKEVKQDTGLTGESIATLKKLKAALENAD